MSLRQMLPFLLLNIVVSAVVVLSILFWWDNRQGGLAEPMETPAAFAGLPTPAIAAPPSGTVAPEATAEAEAEDSGPVIHVVAAGDTLGRIASQYDVPMDDIMLVNGLTNANLLSVGQQLTIPVGGIPTPTPEGAAEIVALPTPIPTEPLASSGQGNIEVAGVVDPGVLETEAVQIVNSGTDPQAMQGWKVRDEDGNVYTFGQVSIFGQGAGVTVHSRAGEDSATDLYWGLDAPAWRSGELLTLWDASDTVVGRLTIP